MSADVQCADILLKKAFVKTLRGFVLYGDKHWTAIRRVENGRFVTVDSMPAVNAYGRGGTLRYINTHWDLVHMLFTKMDNYEAVYALHDLD